MVSFSYSYLFVILQHPRGAFFYTYIHAIISTTPLYIHNMKLLPAIHPDLSIERKYHKALVALLKEIRLDVDKSIKDPNMALDGVKDWLGHTADFLMDKWTKKLNALADEMAELFVNRLFTNYDRRMKSAMRKAGFTVKLQMSEKVEKRVQEAVAENVGLIKSIGTTYLSKVNQATWTMVKGGFNLKEFADTLEHSFGVERKRCNLIARDQMGKASIAIQQARHEELGLYRAIWLHSHAGKVPRQSHVRANGKEFDIRKGMYIDGEYILPASKVNCKCNYRIIIDDLLK